MDACVIVEMSAMSLEGRVYADFYMLAQMFSVHNQTLCYFIPLAYSMLAAAKGWLELYPAAILRGPGL